MSKKHKEEETKKDKIKEKKIEKKNNKVEEKNQKVKKIDNDDEPSFYHYVLAFFLIAGIVFGIYLVVDYYEDKSELKRNGDTKFYVYNHKVGNITYKVHFRHPVEDLMINLSNIPNSKKKFLNSLEVIFSFDEYNKSDNAKVTVAGTQLGLYLRNVLFLNLGTNTTDILNCNNATDKSKVVTLNPYSNSNIVYWENDCLRINATNSDNLIFLSNQIMYKLTQE